MADNLGVRLKVGLSQDTKQIRKDLKKLQKELDKYTLNLNTSVSGKGGKNGSGSSATKTATANKKLKDSYSSLAQELTKVFNSKGELIKVQEKYNTSLDVTTTKVTDLANANRNYTKVTDKTVVNREKMNKQIDQFAKKLEIAKIQAKATTNQALQFGNALQHEKLKQYNNEIQNMTTKQNMTQKELTESTQKLKVMQANLNATSKEARALGNNSMKFGKMLSTAFEKFAIWMTATGVFFGLQRAIRAAAEAVHELDDALVELNKVADLTNEELKTITEEAYEIGDSIGALGVELVNATADFARMGFSAREALDLAEQALILKNIGDGIETVGEASSTMISVMKGFGIEVENSMHIIDAMNEVSNNFAVTTQDLAEGLRNASATMSQSGTTLEETIAILTAGNEVMQNMSKTSTGLVTISQRLRGLSEAAEEGEDFTNFTAKLQEQFKSIADVDIMKDGQLRSTYEILVDMAEAQSRLTAEQMQYLGELAAGKRQVKIWNSILQNSSTLTTANTTAINSQGSALEENAKVVESITGHLNRFKNALNELWTNSLSKDTVKLVLDFTTSLIKLIDKIGLVQLALSTLITLLVTFKRQAIASAVSGLISFITTLATGKFSLDAFTASLVASNVAANVLYATLTFGLSLAITGITAAWIKHNQAVKEANAAYEEFEKVTQSSEATLEERRNAAINALKEEEEAQEDHIRTLNNLNKILWRNGEAYEYYNETIAQRDRLLENELKRWVELKDFLSRQTVFFDAEKYSEESRALADSVEQITEEAWNLSEAFLSARDTIESLASAYQTLASGEKLSLDQIVDLIEKYPEYRTEIAKLNNAGEDRIGILEAIMNAETEQARQSIKDSMDIVKAKEIEQRAIIQTKIANLLEKGTWEEVYPEIRKAKNEMVSYTEELDVLQDLYDSLTPKSIEIATSTKELKEQTKELSAEVENLSDEIKIANADVDDFGEAIEKSLENQIETMKEQQDLIDSQINAIKDAKELREDELKTEEKLLAVEKAREVLANTLAEENVKVLGEDGVWRWVANPSEVAKAQEDLKSAQENLAEWQEELEYKKSIAILEAKKESYQSEINIAENAIDRLKSIEADSFIDRLNAFKTFVQEWNTTASMMQYTTGISAQSPSVSNVESNVTEAMKANSKAWNDASEADRKKLADANLSMGTSMGWTRGEDGYWYKSNGSRAYANGGINDYTGTAMMHGTRSRPEMVLNNSQAARLFDFIKNIPNYTMSPVASMGGGSSTTIQNLNITAQNGDTLQSLIIQAKTMARNGFRG